MSSLNLDIPLYRSNSKTVWGIFAFLSTSNIMIPTSIEDDFTALKVNFTRTYSAHSNDVTALKWRNMRKADSECIVG